MCSLTEVTESLNHCLFSPEFASLSFLLLIILIFCVLSAVDDVPPYFKMDPPQTQVHLEGNRLVLTCMAEGSWPLEFKWIYNGTEITPFSLEYRYKMQPLLPNLISIMIIFRCLSYLLTQGHLTVTNSSIAHFYSYSTLTFMDLFCNDSAACLLHDITSCVEGIVKFIQTCIARCSQPLEML